MSIDALAFFANSPQGALHSPLWSFYHQLYPKATNMKGNDGKASQQRLRRKLCILSAVVVPLMFISLLGAFKSSLSESYEEYSRVWRVLDENVPVDDEVWQDILRARRHVSELAVFPEQSDGTDNYSGFYVYFCRLEWNLHKENPSQYAMFRFLVRNSPDCQSHLVKVPLRLAVDRIREFDRTHLGSVNHLQLSAAVFHESRCGSTLTANMLAAMNPPKTRVYSESIPIITALWQYYDGDPRGISLLHDVMYMLLRSDDKQEERAFFKFPSYTTLNLNLFRTAFPDTPWMFIYRDPVQVMMSYFKHDPTMKKLAGCNSPYGFESLFRKTVEHHAHRHPQDLSRTEHCAAHLGTLTESAVHAMTNDNPDLVPGIAVNYNDLPHALWEEILPNRIGLVPNADEMINMQACSQDYSKGWDKDRHHKFEQDAESKDKRATDEIRNAAETFLKESYVALEEANVLSKK